MEALVFFFGLEIAAVEVAFFGAACFFGLGFSAIGGTALEAGSTKAGVLAAAARVIRVGAACFVGDTRPAAILCVAIRTSMQRVKERGHGLQE